MIDTILLISSFWFLAGIISLLFATGVPFGPRALKVVFFWPMFWIIPTKDWWWY